MSCVGGTAIAVVAGNVAGAVSFQSLEARLRGPSCDCGVARQAQRADELTARRWRVHPFAGQAGYRVGIDAAAAVFVHGGEPDAAPPPAMTGSHFFALAVFLNWILAHGFTSALEGVAVAASAGFASNKPPCAVCTAFAEAARFDGTGSAADCCCMGKFSTFKL